MNWDNELESHNKSGWVIILAVLGLLGLGFAAGYYVGAVM